jgi:TonB family C-terminal domain
METSLKDLSLSVILSILPLTSVLAWPQASPNQSGATNAVQQTTPTDLGCETSDTLEVLSDTMGVDFGPYLNRVVQNVRQNWYNLIPQEARPPILKEGRVAIQFAIMKDGAVAGVQFHKSSGDVELDRAAWGGITASNPFPAHFESIARRCKWPDFGKGPGSIRVG